MNLPKTYTSHNETGCCPVPNVADWDEKEIQFENKRFIRMYVKSFLHMPLNMGAVMKDLNKVAMDAEAMMPTEQAMVLSRELSPWKSEQLYSVSHAVSGVENVILNGTFLTKVFEGPYQDAGKWYHDMVKYVADKNYRLKNIYFFYTTCPKCAKHYGKNYTIVFAEVEK